MSLPNAAVAAYLRISLDAKGDAVSTARQSKRALEMARQHGLPKPIDYLEPGSTSASAPRKKASAYARLLDDVRAGKAKVVIVWDVDRLTRQPVELEEWLVLCERHGVRLITMDGECDTRTASGKLFLRIRASVARYEIDHKSARQRDANRDRAERGVPWRSGPRPFGYTDDRTAIVEVEAEHVRQAYRDTLAGVSLRAQRRRWEEAGLLNPNSGEPKWPAATFRAVLTRPAYAGLRILRGVEYPASVPPIVEPDLWRAAQVVLADPGRRTTDAPGRPRQSLLSGIATCGRCGGPLTSGRALDHRTKEYYRTLRCQWTPHLSRKAELIEAYVSEVVLARLSRPEARRLFEVMAPDLAPQRTRAADLRAQREALATDLTVDLQFAVKRDARLRAELDAVEHEIAAALAGSAVLPFATYREPREVWEELDLDARRDVIRILVDVEVQPLGRGRGGPFDPATVKVTRKG